MSLIKKPKKNRPPILEALEPRILFSADAFGAALDNYATDDPLADALDQARQEYDALLAESKLANAQQRALEHTAQSDVQDALPPADEQNQATRELVFVDTDTPHYQQLVDDLAGNADSSRQFHVILLDNSADGIAQITDALAQYTELDAVHIISHGADGSIDLGNTQLNEQTLIANSDAISAWSNAFSANGDLLIYGCDLAATSDGELLVNRLAAITGTDVAASDDLTGNAALGGDFDLEYSTGEIETDLAISSEAQQLWQAVLLDTTLEAHEPSIGSLDISYELKSTDNWGQSFTHNSGNGTYEVNKIDIVLDKVSGAGSTQTFTVTLRDSWNGTILGSDSISVNEISTSEAWYSFDIGSATLTDNTNYFIRVESDSTTGKVYIGVDPAGSYSGGQLINNAGSGDAGKDAAFRAINVTYNAPTLDASEANLWLSTIDDVTGSAATGLANWTDGDLLSFAAPSLAFGENTTSGNLSATGFNLDNFAGDADIDALHYVTRELTLGSGTDIIELRAGDILFSTASGETLTSTNSISVSSKDLVLFRADTLGDYSAGTFAVVLDEPNGNEIKGVALVEETIMVGDANLTAGTFILSEGDKNLYHYAPVTVGETTTTGPAATLLVEGPDIGIDQNIIGVHLVQQSTTTGGVTLAAGQLLVSLDNEDSAVGTGPVDTERRDVLELTVTQTGATTLGDADIFFDGDDIGLADNKENLDALTLVTQPRLDPIFEDISNPANTGTLVADLVNGIASDLDGDPIGIAITATDEAFGTWEYSTNGGSTWLAVGSVADNDALVLSNTGNDLLRFVPNAESSGTASIDFRAWDGTDGNSSGTANVDTSTNGNSSAYSSATATASLEVVGINDSPQLDNTGDMSLSSIAENDFASSGDLVSNIIDSAGGDRITDNDSGAIEGLAIIDVNDANGVWEYSIDNGSNWTPFGIISEASATLISATANDLIRFVPDPDFAATVDPGITFRAWDMTDYYTSGATSIDVTTNGGSTAFSASIETASIAVIPDATNAAPENIKPANQSIDEDTALVFSSANGNAITIIDDSGDDELEITLGVSNGTLTLGSLSGLTFTAGGDGQGSMTFTATLVDTNAALEGLTYQPDADFNGSDPLTITTNDQGFSGSGGPFSDVDVIGISVDAVNDAPVLTVGGSEAIAEDATITFNTANANLISLVDIDSGASELEVTLVATHGTMTLSGITGLTFSAGDGTADPTITFRGTVSDLNAALDGMVFTPDSHYAGSAMVDVFVDDLGNTGSGGSLFDRQVIDITISADATNDAPINTVPATQATNEDTSLELSVANGNAISVSDDSGTNLIEVTLSADNGTLTLDNRIGPEFTINSTTSGTQQDVQILTTATGTGIAVWSSNGQDGSGHGIFAQLYDSNGVAVGTEIPVNTFTVDHQKLPDVAAAADGSFVVVWQSDLQDGSGEGIYAQRFDAAGNKVGLEFKVNSFTADDQQLPAVAMNATGEFVVTWQSKNQDGDGEGIYAQRYDNAGNTVGGELLVNAITANNQKNPDIGMDAAGNFVVVWDSKGQDADKEAIIGRRFEVGTGFGAEFQINNYEPDDQENAVIAMQSTGEFVVAWQSNGQDGGGKGIYAQLFDNSTIPVAVGSEIPVNSNTANNQQAPTISMNSSGEFLIAWQSKGQDDPDGKEGVYAQLFLANGTAQGAEFQLNTVTPGNQRDASVSLLDDGSMWTAWDNKEIFSQRFQSHNIFTFTAGTGANDASMTFSGTQADINEALDGLVYTPNLDFVGAVTITLTTNDNGHTGGGSLTDIDSFIINVAAANDAPVVTVPALQNTSEEIPVVFSTGNGNLVSISDIDADAGLVELTLTATNGSMSLNGIAGLTFSVGDGTADTAMTLQGSVADINAALDGLSFTSPTDYVGLGLIRLTVDDLGNTGIGGSLVDSAAVYINITADAVNDAPTIQPPADFALPIDTGVTFDGANLISILDDADQNSIELTLTVSNGTVTFNEQIDTEHLVNTEIANTQLGAVVAAAPNGSYVIVWQSNNQDTDGEGIFAQVYDAFGIAQGAEIQVNTEFSGNQITPAVAMDSLGNFVVAWESDGNLDGDGRGIFVQMFSADGQKVDIEFQGNTTADDDQTLPAIGMDDLGNFVLAWQSKNQDGNGEGIFAQRFDSNGFAINDEFQVNSTFANNQIDPAVAVAANGDFVIVWTSTNQDGDGDGIFAQRYDANGIAQGIEFQVNFDGVKHQRAPAVAIDALGNFVVAWQSENQDTDGYGIYARRFDAAGNALDPADVLVNTYIAKHQIAPSISMNAVGEYIIAWQSQDQDTNGEGTYGQWFNASGTAIGGEVRLNTTVTNDQTAPSVAITGSGDYIAAWTSKNQDTDAEGIYARQVASPGGLNFTTGDGVDDNSIVVTGRPDRINAALNGMTFTPTLGFNGLATIQIDVDDLGSTGTGGPYTDTHTINLVYNTAPTLNNSGTPSLTAINEDDISNTGDLVSSIIASGAGGNPIDDADAGASEGIAVVAVDNTNGTWEYSINGGGLWAAIGAVTNSSAVLLGDGANDRIRFVPNANYNGAAGNITFRAWDATDGNASGTTGIDVSVNGGNTSYSAATETAGITVNSLNDDPTVDNVIPDQGATEDNAFNFTFNANTFGDVDSGDTLTYSATLSGGAPLPGWLTFNAATRTFSGTPLNDDVGTISVEVTADDGNGGTPATDTFDIVIANTNDAPTLNSGSLTAVNEVTVNPAGEAVSTIFSGQFSDVDSGSSMSGIAVIGNTANAVSEGSWQYSTNAGTDWFDIGTVADDNTALAISSSTLIRFVPASGFSGAPADLSVRGVDNVYAGAFSTTAGSESRVNLDTTTNGGSSAIAAAPANVSTNVTDNEFLWLVSKDNVASPSGANGLDSWTDSTALQFGEPDLTLGAGITDGNLSAVFELDTFAGADARIHALHQVTRDLSLGGSSFPTIDVKTGDILFATKDAHTLTSGNSVNNNSTDVVLFSPTTLGDYSTGTFTILLENVNGNDIHGLTLVEESTTLADGTVLNEGDFLLSTTGVGNERQLFWFVTDDVGDGGNTAGTLRTLLDGNDTNINLLSDFKGIDLVETNTTIGGLNLTAGQILISTKDSITGGSNNLLFTNNDVIALSISQTTWSAGAGNGAASVTIVMDGDNIGLDSDPERVHALSIGKSEFGSAPVQSSIEGANLTFTENDAATQITNTIAIADVDDTHIESAVVQISTNYANGEDVLLFTNTGTITGVWNVGTGTMTLTGSDTLANYEAALRSISYQNTSDDPSTATRTVSFTVNDGDANSNPLTRDIDVAAANDDPTVDNIIPDQAATEDTAFSFAFNANTFGDVDSGDTLTYSATLSGGGALPSWLTFNAATRTFSGTPLNADVGTISVEVTADDGNGGTPATDTFDIVISNTNDDPTVDNVIPDQAATEDSAFSFAFNANTFGDVDSGDTLTYSATLSGGGALPSWLTFNAGTRTFSGTPLNVDVGTISVEVTADDGNGGTPATDTFDIVISNTNDDPTVDNVIPDQAATEDSAFSFAFNANTFGDVDSGDTLTYSATLSGGAPLPGWLTFNAGTRTFSGTPLNADVGTISVEVTADDGNGGTPATDTFDIVISNTNDDPTVDNVIPDQAATEDSAFSFAFNANTFGDVDSGDTLTYSATLSGGAPLPGWLTFNAGTRTFSGTPLNADVGTISVEVTADDGNGGTPATDTFDIVISNTNDDPTVDNVIPDQAATEDSAFSFAFNANTFGDVDSGDTLTYSATLSGGAPLPGWLTFNAATRTFSGTPLNADVGTISVEVTADDGNGGTPATDTFDIVVSNTNDDPTVDNIIPDQAATEDSAFSFAFNANTFGDVDSGDTLTYSATLSGGAPLPGWLTFNAATRTFSGTPLNADVGTISVEVTADDGNGGTPATDTFDIVISNTNDDPTVDNVIPDQAATEDSAFSFAFNANTFGDVDSGDTLTYSATLSGGAPLPGWLSFNAATRTFSGTPLNADVGTISVEVTADDGNGGTPATDTFDIVISNTNDAPVIGGVDTGDITEDVDPDTDGLLEVNNALTIADPDVGESSFVAGTINGTYGDLVIDAAGNWSYSADNTQAAIQSLDVTEFVTDTLTVTTADGTTHDIVITINGAEDAPTVDNVIADQAASEDTAFSFTFNANSFGDVDTSDTLTYTAQLNGGGALPGWLTFNAGTRTFSGTPLNADVGTISVDVIADDGSSTITDTFDIVIANSNDDPTLDNAIANQAATEDTAFSFTFAANTFGDVDAGDTLTYTATLSGGGALPTWLTFNAGTRTFSGTPLNADVGTIFVEVTADDSNGGTPAIDTFDIVVANTNDDPTLDNAIANQAATEDTAFSFTFASNAFGDVDAGDTLTYTATLSGGGALPSWLTFNAGTRTFSGTPLNADVGTISVEVTADDGNGGTPATDTFDIVIANTNDDPTTDNVIADQAATEDVAFNFTFNANTFGDVDAGDTLTYTATLSGGGALPGWLTFNAGTRTFSGTPLNADVGTISVEVTADDSNGGTPATDTFDIVIANTNDDPTTDNIIADQAATEDTAFSFTFNANTFGDVDSGDTLTYTATLSGGGALPGWLTFNAGTRTFSGTPLNADVGTISVEVTADDGNGGTPATDTFDIVIANSNDDPTTDNVIADQAATEDTAFSFTFNANTFGDVDAGDTLTYSATLSGGGALPSWLTFNAGTRTFSGTPLNADVGTISVEVTADDGNGGTPATDTFDIVVSNTNDDPTVDNIIPDQAATEDSAFSFAFNANTFGDVDSGDTLTYSATLSGGAPLPGWLTFNAATRTFSGTPLNADVGTISVEVTADDGNGGTPATDTFDIDISNTNDDPTVDNVIPDQAATEDTAFSFAFNANTFGDVDSGDTLTYSATLSGGGALPSWLTFNAATRTFSGTPLNADVGTISVEVTADDGNGGTLAKDTFDIVISNTNDAPVIGGVDTGDITEDVDPDTDGLLEVNNALTIADPDVGESSFVAETINGTYGDLVIDAAGNWSYSADNTQAPIQQLDVSEFVTDTLTVTTADGSTHDIVITINGAEDAPTVDNAIADQATTEDAAFSFTFDANSFSDVDASDTLTYTAQLNGGGTLPGWLTFNAGTRTFSGTPLNADVGTISVDVIADDGSSTITDTFDIVIANSNDDPTLDNAIANQAATEDTAFSFTFAANTFGDVDAGDTLTYTATLSGGGALPTWLTFNAGTRTFSGTPLNADVGTIFVEVTADDSNGGTPAIDTFDIVVANTDDAPVIGGVDTGAVTEDVDPDTDTLLEANDALTIADPDVGESNFVAETINGTYGDLVIDTAGNWSYSADNTQAAIQQLDVSEFINDTLTVTTADGSTHDIVITINGAEDAPTVDNAIPDQSTAEDSVYNYTFNANVFGDADASDNFTYSAQLSGGAALPSWLTFNDATRSFVGVPLNADVGFIDIEVIADDGSSTVSDIFRLTITNTNDAPTIGGDDTGAVTEDVDPDTDTLLEDSGALTIADPDAGESSFVADTINGTYGDLVIDTAGNWSYSADNTQAAIQQLDVTEFITDTLTVTTADGTTHDIVITINGAEDAPVLGGTNTGTVAEDGTLVASNTLTITDTDSNDNPISYNDQTSVAGSNGYGNFVMSGNTWTYTLNNNHAAVQALDVTESLTDTFTFTATDGSSTQTVNVTINGAEDTPTVDNIIADQSATEDTPYSFTFNANSFGDVDTSDTLTYTAQLNGGGALPGWLTFNAGTRTFSGTPLNADVGTINIDVIADDGSSTIADTFMLTVNNTDDAPVIGGVDTGPVTEDIDPDSDTLLEVNNALTIADPDVGESSFVAATINGTYGDLVIDTAGNWSYSADNTQAAIQQLDVTEFVTDTLTVTTADGTTHDIVITINGAEDAPTVDNAIADQAATEDALFSFTFNANSFGDVDTSDTLTYTAQLSGGGALPTWLSFDAGTRTFNGTPLNADVGTISIDVIADDGSSTITDTFDIVIANTNDDPTLDNVIADQAATEDTAFSFTFNANTFGDVDAGDTLTYTATLAGGGALPGWLTFNAGTRTFSGTPLNADVGTISIEVTADDSNGGTPATDTFDIVVANTDDAPVIGGVDTGAVTEDVDPDSDGLLEVNNALTIADPDVGESSFVAATIGGTYGDLVIDTAGNWSYSADNTQAAIQSLDVTEWLTDTLTVTTADGSTHDIVITINGAEDAPVLGGVNTGTVAEDGTLVASATLTITDVDANDNPISFNDQTSIAGSNGYGNFVMSGNTWTYTLNNNHAAVQALDVSESLSDTFTFTASDGSSTQTVTVTINGAEDASVAGGTNTGSVAEDGTLVAGDTLTITDVDSNDNPVSYNDQTSIAGDNGYGNFTMSGNNWTYTLANGSTAVQSLDAGQTVNDSFTFTASDGTAQLVTVTISGNEDAPTASDNTIRIDQNTSHTLSASDFGFSDIDGDAMNSVRITALETAGDLKLAGSDVNLNDIISRADIDAGLLTWAPLGIESGDNYATFGFSVNDGAIDSGSHSITYDVTALFIPDPDPTPDPDPDPEPDPEPNTTPDTETNDPEPEAITPAPEKLQAQDEDLPIDNGLTGIISDTTIDVVNMPQPLAADTVAELMNDKPDQDRESLPLKQFDLANLDISEFTIENLQLLQQTSFLNNDRFVDALDNLSYELDQVASRENAEYSLGAETRLGIAVSLSAGFVSWALRAGSLLASMFSVMPLWKQLDPLPIVGTKTENEDELEARAEEDESTQTEARDALQEHDQGQDARLEKLFKS